jgi:hypothetical protein
MDGTFDRHGDSMKASLWIGIAGALALSGCMTPVDREAIAFPDMPKMPIYQRADGRPSSSDEAMSALQTAEMTCHDQGTGSTDTGSAVGSPAFDSCMQGRGYHRVQ